MNRITTTFILEMYFGKLHPEVSEPKEGILKSTGSFNCDSFKYTYLDSDRKLKADYFL